MRLESRTLAISFIEVLLILLAPRRPRWFTLRYDDDVFHTDKSYYAPIKNDLDGTKPLDVQNSMCRKP